MAKGHILEIVRVLMAIATRAAVMVLRRIVAGAAIRVTNRRMIKRSILEVVRVLVAIPA